MVKINLQKLFVTLLLLCITNFFVISSSLCKSYQSGHRTDFRSVLEGLRGQNFEDLMKDVSKTIDNDLLDTINTKFPQMQNYNHRIFGHWGFEGPIPFDTEPYKTYLSQYPKEEIVGIWKNTVDNLTKRAVQLTGLPEKQAKGLVGLLYNSHLLGDWAPGNKIIDPLLHPKMIQNDIVKNLHRLFGNNSSFVKTVEQELMTLKPGADLQQYADDVLNVLKKHDIGETLNKYYGERFLSKYKITYKPPKTISSETNKLSNNINKFDDYNKEALAKEKNVKVAAGILRSDGRLILSLKEGATAGILVFAFDAGSASYQYMKGDVFKPEFERKVMDAAVKGGTVGGGVAVAVFLGSNPAGLIVMGVATGTYFLADYGLNVLHKYQDSKYLSKDDLAAFGIEMDSILDIESDSSIPLNATNW